MPQVFAADLLGLNVRHEADVGSLTHVHLHGQLRAQLRRQDVELLLHPSRVVVRGDAVVNLLRGPGSLGTHLHHTDRYTLEELVQDLGRVPRQDILQPSVDLDPLPDQPPRDVPLDRVRDHIAHAGCRSLDDAGVLQLLRPDAIAEAALEFFVSRLLLHFREPAALRVLVQEGGRVHFATGTFHGQFRLLLLSLLSPQSHFGLLLRIGQVLHLHPHNLAIQHPLAHVHLLQPLGLVVRQILEPRPLRSFVGGEGGTGGGGRRRGGRGGNAAVAHWVGLASEALILQPRLPPPALPEVDRRLPGVDVRPRRAIARGRHEAAVRSQLNFGVKESSRLRTVCGCVVSWLCQVLELVRQVLLVQALPELAAAARGGAPTRSRGGGQQSRADRGGGRRAARPQQPSKSVHGDRPCAGVA
mmetsp:Transcript_50401/g.163101  ORF Transcript_50401/g.163101 Transcript_50401/m.163101 type:complete len:414 (-) Transcript_50401:38-1279(-)